MELISQENIFTEEKRKEFINHLIHKQNYLKDWKPLLENCHPLQNYLYQSAMTDLLGIPYVSIKTSTIGFTQNRSQLDSKTVLFCPSKCYFTVGTAYKMNTKENQTLLINEVQIMEQLATLIHLQVDYSLYMAKRKKDQFTSQLHEILSTIEYYGQKISAATTNRIVQQTLGEEPFLRVKDISNQRSDHTLLEVKYNDDNEPLENYETYILGQIIELNVKRRYASFRLFLQGSRMQDCTEESKLIFRSIHSIRERISFLGHHPEVENTLNEIRSNTIPTEQAFEQRLQDNAGLRQRFQEALEKPTILLQFTKDPQLLSDYILITPCMNQIFTIGRAEGSNIMLHSQTVSRYHGCIEYLEDKKIFVLRDGQFNEPDQIWKHSLIGTWRCMIQNKFYKVRKNQKIRINNTDLQFEVVFPDQQGMGGGQQQIPPKKYADNVQKTLEGLWLAPIIETQQGNKVSSIDFSGLISNSQ